MDPLYGFGRAVVLVDVAHELAPEIGDGSEDAAGDHIALDLGEPQLDLVKRVHGRGLVGRQIVGNHVDFLALGLAGDDIGQKRHELGRGMEV